ncbi:hypothetical protein F2Q68_00011888 [Brassica cretica]|uniref:Uncharacterized protein n=1 Tax=Brassica cretica TaxID=69181 RepID=A0A3N6QTD2_BRACR|nr:hypothetical protein F2Q68_00011888 [Brassica cretica]
MRGSEAPKKITNVGVRSYPDLMPNVGGGKETRTPNILSIVGAAKKQGHQELQNHHALVSAPKKRGTL